MKLPITLLALALLAVGCNQTASTGKETTNAEGKKLVIGATMLSMQHEFVVNVHDEIVKQAEKDGIELITVDAERSALKQVEQVESFIAQNVDAIILNPAEVEACSPAVTKALAAGIPIINVNSETSAKPSAFVGSDDVEAGRIAMQHIADQFLAKRRLPPSIADQRARHALAALQRLVIGPREAQQVLGGISAEGLRALAEGEKLL